MDRLEGLFFAFIGGIVAWPILDIVRHDVFKNVSLLCMGILGLVVFFYGVFVIVVGDN